MLEPDYYFDGKACYLSCDVGSNDDCGYNNDKEHWDDEPYSIYDEVVGVYNMWRGI